jgi:penicillin amidase
MAWDLGGNMRMEIERAMALGSLPPERAAQLFPSYPGDRHPYITVVDPDPDGASTPAFVIPDDAFGALTAAAATISLVDDVTLGGEGTGIGSNSWVVSGENSPTGMPLLANDPHLGAQMPSIWYQVGLHCRTVSDACPFDVAGFSFAGVPGVIIGHNADIAWGFTNVSPDVQDLYIEKINPANPDQYEVDGAWIDMDVRTEVIEVAGGDPVTIEVKSTRHGPIISDSFEPLEDFDESGVFRPEPYAVALRWTGLDPSPSLVQPILGINAASNFDEFRNAAELFDVPSQNLLYADIEGNIGYQMPGKVPIRTTGNGTLPSPGWTNDYEWTGFVPFDELPTVYNPDTGWIVTANNAVVNDAYEYFIAHDWAFGYRARRIVDLLTSNLGIGVDGFATLQYDSYDLNAQHVLPYLENAIVVVPGIEIDAQDTDAINQLFAWDLQNFAGSTGAAIWNATWRNLLDLTFTGEVHEDFAPEGNGRWFEVVRNLLELPNDPFWDDPATPAVEDRDTILVLSFLAAVDELTETVSDTVGEWSWGDIHTMTFRNQTLGESGIGLIDDRFNRGPYPASGSEGMVNAVGWTATEGYEVDWLPSMRMVVDLGDLSRSTAIHTTGQSGHVDHPHYDDMIPLWLAGDTVAMLWNRTDVDSNAEAILLLVP